MYQQRVYAVVTFARRFNSSKESANIAYSVPAKGFRPPYYHPLKPRGRKSSEPFPPFPVSDLDFFICDYPLLYVTNFLNN